MPGSEPTTPARPRPGSVVYWVACVLLYAGAAALYPPVALLGFWQSIPFVLVAHIARPHVLRLVGAGG